MKFSRQENFMKFYISKQTSHRRQKDVAYGRIRRLIDVAELSNKWWPRSDVSKFQPSSDVSKLATAYFCICIGLHNRRGEKVISGPQYVQRCWFLLFSDRRRRHRTAAH